MWFMCAIVAFILGYLLHDNFEFVKTWFAPSKPKPTKKSDTLPPVPSPSLDTGSCSFSEEDIMLRQVYDYNGVPVTQNKITCSNCNQYVFRDEDGCVTYGYTGEGGVCTIGGFTGALKKTCSSDTDCRDTSNIVSLSSSSVTGTRCISGSCNAWEIQDSKTCPASFK